MSKGARRRGDRLGKWALAVGSPLLFFGLLELLFALVGVRPALEREDPFVGFAGRSPVFVPQRPAGGEPTLVTADARLELFNAQRFARRKPPGGFRIFCLGGSTTYGRPYDDATSFAGWLREMLPALDPSRRWEVINAGGVSYASYRVTRVLEEVAGYQPDLVIVYTGQNEFLEERTYAGVRDLPRPLRDLRAWLARTRTWAALAGAMRGVGLIGSQAAGRGRDLLPQEVAARLDRSAGLDLYHRDDRLRDQVLRHYRTSLERMAAIAAAAGSRLIFVTPASNLRNCSPFKSEHTGGLAPAEVRRSEELLETGRRENRRRAWERALAALDEALALDPRYAELHYERGRALFALGRHGEAKRAFVRARDEDVCPLRALSAMRRILEEVAASSGTRLVDFIRVLERDLERTRGHAILGEEDFLDHVHPTIDGHRRLALALVEAMRAEGLLPAAASLGAGQSAEIGRRIEGRVDRRRAAEALASLAWTLEWAGKEEDSRRLAFRALESGVESTRILLIAGKHLALAGESARARELYRRAVRADPLSPTPRYQMGLLAISRGELEVAAAHLFLASVLWPDDARTHEKLGLVMAERGRYRLAIASLDQARRRDPGRRSVGALIERVRRYAGLPGAPVGSPEIVLERHPSGVVSKAAQARRNAAGRTVLHGLYTEWAEDGTLLRVADTVNAKFRGADLRWGRAAHPAAGPEPTD